MVPWVGAACRRAAMPKLLHSYCPGTHTVASYIKRKSTSSNLMPFIGELSHRAAVNLICNYPPTSNARLYEPFAQFQSGTAMLESNCRIRNNHIRNQIQNQQETTINKRQATKVGLECPRACY